MSVAYLKGLHLQKHKYSLICTCVRVYVCTLVEASGQLLSVFPQALKSCFWLTWSLLIRANWIATKHQNLPVAWDGKHKLPFLALLHGLWDSKPSSHTCMASALLTEKLYQHLLTYYWVERGVLLGMRVSAHMWSWGTMSGSWLSPSTKRIMGINAGSWAWRQAPFFVLSHQSASDCLLNFLFSFLKTFILFV